MSSLEDRSDSVAGLHLSPYASFVAIVATALLVGCPKAAPATTTADDAAVSVVASASAPAPVASVSAPPPSETLESAAMGDGGLDLRMLGQANQHADPDPGGLGGLAAFGDSLTDAGTRGDVALGNMTVTRGKVTNYERTLAGLRPRLRNCFNKGLQMDPAMKGTVTFVFEISPTGETTSVVATGTGTIAQTILFCMKSSATRVQFDAPGAGGAQATAKATCTTP